MKLSAYSVTDIGRTRKLNQDYVFTSQMPLGQLPNLFIVADGMGGHKAGEYASKCAVDTVVEKVSLSREKGTIRILSKAIRQANTRIREKAASDENFQGMGTTLVAASFDEEELIVANVGDSRLYLFKEGRLKQITTDHSLVEEMIRMGELERKDARLHPDKNIITRAIGAADDVDVDFFEVDGVEEGDIILMCTDGLSNMLDDREIEGIIASGDNVEETAERLVSAANMNGGRDNIGVVLVKVAER
ncbi:MAG: Stp1/IreP family PP2C-type Ser/Thr phosphatase [Lachnospiraceae bacterium]|nr:Stp1/IreP family PP2C-type Ser/Thr phosphatase [Lachnospiraceae bacterium]